MLLLRFCFRQEGSVVAVLQFRVRNRLSECPGERFFAQFLRGGVTRAAVPDDAQAEAALLRQAAVGRLPVPGLEVEGAFRGGEHFQVHPLFFRLAEQPRACFVPGHTSPPTTSSLTSRCGCPISTGSDPLMEPHIPGSLLRSSDTAAIFRIVSGPLPSSIAPRTGSAISPLRIMNPSVTAKLYSPEPGFTWPPPSPLAYRPRSMPRNRSSVGVSPFSTIVLRMREVGANV